MVIDKDSWLRREEVRTEDVAGAADLVTSDCVEICCVDGLNVVEGCIGSGLVTLAVVSGRNVAIGSAGAPK